MKNEQDKPTGGQNKNQEQERGNSNQQQPTNGIVGDNTEKDPDQWVTGDEPITGAQRSYLKTLSDEAGEEFNDQITKAEASKKIDELQHKTGRGLNT
jgi:hypothetical protein